MTTLTEERPADRTDESLLNRTDEQLMNLYQCGSEAAFEALHARYERPLRGFIRRTILGMAGKLVEDADDILQLTFAFIHKYRSRFIRGTLVRPWLYTTADRLTRNHVKHATCKCRNFRRTLPLVVGYSNGDPDIDAATRIDIGENTEPCERYRQYPAELVQDGGSTPAEICVDTEAAAITHERAVKCLSVLPATHQRVLDLLFFQGLTAQEAARRLGIPKTTVDWRKREALDLMRGVNTRPQ